MSVNEDWARTEKCLPFVADSMGHLLARMRPHISARILDGPALWRLLDCASDLPVTAAAFPFGIEVPLHVPEPRSNFGISLVGDSLTARHFQQGRNADDTEKSSAGVAWILDETDRETSILRRVIGRKMGLEFEISLAEGPSRTDPGIFLFPAGDVLEGGAGRFQELGAVHDALVFAGGWNPDVAERRELDRLYAALPPKRRIRRVGAFPSQERTIRTTATDFRTAVEVMAYLERAGWPGDASAVGEVVSFFDEHKTFVYLGLQFDVTANGLGPSLGLSFYAHESDWLKDMECWMPLIEAIGERKLALPGKLEELARWSNGTVTMYSEAGPIILVRGIHHVEMSIIGDNVGPVNGYVFFLMMSTRPGKETAGRGSR